MTEFSVLRIGRTIGVTLGAMERSVECRNVQSAVELQSKLTSDRAFAERWVHDKDPKFVADTSHWLEWPALLD